MGKEVQCHNCGFWTEIEPHRNGENICKRCEEKLRY